MKSPSDKSLALIMLGFPENATIGINVGTCRQIRPNYCYTHIFCSCDLICISFNYSATPQMNFKKLFTYCATQNFKSE